jgi:hypothetical protein
MEFTVFNTIIHAIQGLLGIATELKKVESQRRDRVVSWLIELSELIKDIALNIESNRYPYHTCAKMEIMVEHFPFIVGDLVHKDKVEVIANMLKASTRVEQLFTELDKASQEDKTQKIITLLHSSGKLQGLASIIRYME